MSDKLKKNQTVVLCARNGRLAATSRYKVWQPIRTSILFFYSTINGQTATFGHWHVLVVMTWLVWQTHFFIYFSLVVLDSNSNLHILNDQPSPQFYIADEFFYKRPCYLLLLVFRLSAVLYGSFILLANFLVLVRLMWLSYSKQRQGHSDYGVTMGDVTQQLFGKLKTKCF